MKNIFFKSFILNIIASLKFTNVHQITEKKQIYHFLTEYSIPQVSCKSCKSNVYFKMANRQDVLLFYTF